MSTRTPEKLSIPNLSANTDGGDLDGLEASLSAEISEIVPASIGENSTGGGGSKNKRDNQVQKDKAAKKYKAHVVKLKSVTPPTKILIKEIRSNILAKLKNLELDQKTAIKSKGRGFSHYNDVVSQMRGLRKIASSLLYKTYEDLKIIWLRIVHDIV